MHYLPIIANWNLSNLSFGKFFPIFSILRNRAPRDAKRDALKYIARRLSCLVGRWVGRNPRSYAIRKCSGKWYRASAPVQEVLMNTVFLQQLSRHKFAMAQGVEGQPGAQLG